MLIPIAAGLVATGVVLVLVAALGDSPEEAAVRAAPGGVAIAF